PTTGIPPVAIGASCRRRSTGARPETVPRVSVQTSRLRLEAIEDDVVRLAGPLFRAVLEISGAPPPLDDDVRREAVLAGYASFLNSLNFPIQVLVRSVPVDL